MGLSSLCWAMVQQHAGLCCARLPCGVLTAGSRNSTTTAHAPLTAPAPAILLPPRSTQAEDQKLTKGAALEKGHFTWITERGRQERWVVASCGNYTVLWNFRRGTGAGGGVPAWRLLQARPLLLPVACASLAWSIPCYTADSTAPKFFLCLMALAHQRTSPPLSLFCPRRSVKIAEPEVVSYGGLTTVTKYHMVRKDEHVVDSGKWLGGARLRMTGLLCSEQRAAVWIAGGLWMVQVGLAVLCFCGRQGF